MNFGNLSWVDWTIIIVSIVALRLVSLSTRTLVKSVADFLSANRMAGRYLLTIASQMGGVGVVTFVAWFEATFSAGITPQWWKLIETPITMVIIPLTGWIFYRFRETRALTMAQFFEQRYSRRFRIFAGIVCWTSGILNFGVFPAVAARFFVYYCGLPAYYHIPGISFAIPTFATVMFIDLAFALSFVTMGGQVSVMVTECVQGIFCVIAFVVISAVVMAEVSWPQMVHALSNTASNASMINPFHAGQVKDFNTAYYLIGLFGIFFTYMSWQGSQGFYSSAKNPHEQRMGNLISGWRLIPQNLMTLILPLAALAILKLPEFSAKAAVINESLKHINNDMIRSQMTVPVTMAHFLPVGIKGLLATVMIFASFTCHDTYMHSWGSILVQDIIIPIRGRALSASEHIHMLRWSIIGVAIFAFLFSLLYPPNQPIFMYFAITGTIWLGGSGAVIIGGLYWKKGTTAGAYSAIILGAILGVAGLIVPVIYKNHFHRDFPVNDQWLYFIGMITSAFLYVVISLLTYKKDYNLKKMLNRGEYELKTEKSAVPVTLKSRWLEVIGINKEFSTGDKMLAIMMIAWNLLWLVFFIVFTVINLSIGASDAVWSRFWHISILINLCVSIPVMVWFTVGGIIDVRSLFHSLATIERDNSDDGSVKVIDNSEVLNEKENINV